MSITSLHIRDGQIIKHIQTYKSPLELFRGPPDEAEWLKVYEYIQAKKGY